MIIQCAACQVRFKVADEKVTERGVRVRCTRCKTVFVVRREAKAADAPSSQGSPPPLPPALSAAQGAKGLVAATPLAARAGSAPLAQSSSQDLVSPSSSPRLQSGPFGSLPSAFSSPDSLGAASEPFAGLVPGRPPLGLKPNPLPLPPSPYVGFSPGARLASGSALPLSPAHGSPRAGALAPSPYPLPARPESSAPAESLDLAPFAPGEGVPLAAGASAAQTPDSSCPIGQAGPESSQYRAPALDQGPDPFGLPASPPTPRAGPLALAPQLDPFSALESAPNSATAAPAQSLLPDLNSFDLSLPEGDSGAEPGSSGELRLGSPAPSLARSRPDSAAPEVSSRSGLELDVSGGSSRVSPEPGAVPSGGPMAGGGAPVKTPKRRRRSVAAALLNALGVFAVGLAVLVVALRHPPPGGVRVSRPADLVRLLPSHSGGELSAADVTTGLYQTQRGQALFVVRGEVVNRAEQPRGPVEVVAVIHQGSEPERREVAFAGAIPTPEDLWKVDGDAALAALKARLNAGALRVEPRGRAPFAAVFVEWPDDIAQWELRLALREAPSAALPGISPSPPQPVPRARLDAQGAAPRHAGHGGPGGALPTPKHAPP